MNRREAVKNVALIMGGTMVGAQAFLTGCSSDKSKPVKELFFEDDVILLNEVSETIIPETDTPGAKAANIGAFIPMMVADCYTEKEQKVFVDGLKQLRKDFEEQYDSDFTGASAADKLAFLTALDKEQKKAMQEREEGDETPPHYFRMIKELTLLGYFTSEPGCTQAMRYIESPGRYDGCIPYKKGDKAWAV